MRTTFIRAGSMAMLLVLMTGCGAIGFKDSTNSKVDPNKKIQNYQASFTLRESRFKQMEGKLIDCNPKKYNNILVLLALSGGGSRAALLAGLSMLEMQHMTLANGSNLLAEVDLISSVSGSSLAAAYYASTGDAVSPESGKKKENPECRQAISDREWNEAEVTRLMSKNYLLPWIGNWFWPDNILFYWFSTYDRTDMMAQTFADNLFDVRVGGRDLRFTDLNPARPNLIINATQGSSNASAINATNNAFGQPFTFTQEDFARVCSSIEDYDLSRGVMASASFPGVFNFMTLKNHCHTDQYVHLFDGGNSDNLGLTSIKRELWYLHKSHKLAGYKRIVVILVDAYTDSNGVSDSINDPRHWYDYVLDTNIITATDSLLSKNRINLLNQFETENVFPYTAADVQNLVKKISVSDVNKELSKRKKADKKILTECLNFFSWETPVQANMNCSSEMNDEFNALNTEINKKMEFVHVKFSDVPDISLKNQLNKIATSFKLNGTRNSSTDLTDKEAIICVAPTLFGADADSSDAPQWRQNKCPKAYKTSADIKDKWQLVRDVFERP